MLSDSVFKSQSMPTKAGIRNESQERTESEKRRRSIKESKSSVIGRIAETISSVVRGKSKET